MKIKMRITSHE